MPNLEVDYFSIAPIIVKVKINQLFLVMLRQGQAPDCYFVLMLNSNGLFKP
jgi:hypothetical protein